MPLSRLRTLLEDESGRQDFRFIIPHPFLPRRYRREAQGRNMLLLLDQELTLHVRWEGDLVHEHAPLTSRATLRLIREVLASMTEYRREVGIFARFIEAWAEPPTDTSYYGDPPKERSSRNATTATANNVGEEQVQSCPPVANPDLGGESPMGIQGDPSCE